MDDRRSLAKYTRKELSTAWPQTGIQQRTFSRQQLSFADVLRTIARRKAPIICFAAIIFSAAAAYAFLKAPSYEGVARLQIDPTRSADLGLTDSDKSNSSSLDTDSHVGTEVAIIQSETVAGQVMESLRLYANPEFAGKNVTGANITSLSQLGPSQRQRLFATFADDLTVRVVPNTQVVEIRFRSTDPTLAKDTANSVIDEYMQRNFHARVDGTAQISQWLSAEMEQIRANTTASQQKLAEFQKANNLLGADESNNIVTDRLKQLNEELTQAEADRIVKEGRYRLARTSNPELIAAVVPSTTLQILRTQQADLQAQYAQLSSKFGDGYPKLLELQSQLDHVNSSIQIEGGNIEKRLANEYDAAAKAEGMIRSDFEKQKTDAYRLNENAAQYANLRHQVDSGQQLYDTLQLKLKEANIASGLNSSFVGIVDRAQMPDKPVEPKKALDLGLGLGAGLFGGLLMGFVLDSFDDTIHTSEEIESVTAMMELTSVPFFANSATGDQKRLASGGLMAPSSKFDPISNREPNCPGAEAYRSLGSLILLSMDTPPKVLVVTSAVPGEGKSTVSSNLATTLAQRGRRVLLVDADLRCSPFQPQNGVKASLSTLFAGGPAEKHCRYQPVSGLPNLHMVSAGFRPTDPTGILDSTRMQELMSTWRAEYDHVIMDTPPVLPFADAIVLAARADGVILVTRSGVSQTKALLRARDVLSRSGANILGFVLNAVRRPEYYNEYPAYFQAQNVAKYSDARQKKN
jgi:succinoglycan biosynthesis transport protein ExoP